MPLSGTATSMQPSSSSSSSFSVVVPAATIWSRSLTRLLRGSGWLLLGLCALLAALSFHGFTLYCENFGCIYRGLVWVVWAVLAGVGLVAALAVRAWQRRRGFSTRASRNRAAYSRAYVAFGSASKGSTDKATANCAATG